MNYVLLLSYDWDNKWMQRGVRRIQSYGVDDLVFIQLDNKSGRLIEIYNGNVVESYAEKGVNDCYEFSGYFFLLNKVKSWVKEGDRVVLGNDTFFKHHAFYIWVLIVIRMLKEKKMGGVWGDVRKNGNFHSFVASWLFMFSFEVFEDFYTVLRGQLDCATDVKKNYYVDHLEEFGSNLSREERLRLCEWLFNESRLKGWVYSTDFNEMPVETRARKGFAIHVEHKLGVHMQDKGVPFYDLKEKMLLAKLANFIDRGISLFQRVLFKVFKIRL